MTRVTDKMVSDWLIWARNFDEIVAYHVGKGDRRRFRVRLTPGITCDGAPFRPKEGIFDLTGHRAEDVVPAEFAFTAREALAFAFGCAAGRTAALAAGEDVAKWRQGRTEEWTPAAREAFQQRREEAREANRQDLDREAAEREAERQQRVADYRRRKAARLEEGAE